MQTANRHHGMLALAVAASLISVSARATTYYVNSNGGSDSNSGTSPNAAWQNLTMVDATTFQPGDSILLADGSNWYGQQLVASSAGTPSNPITYSNYGTGSDPTIWGSIPLTSSDFQPVAGANGTYYAPAASIDSTWSTYSPVTTAGAPVTSVFVNQQFLHSAALINGSTAPLSYVEGNANTWYYDSSSANPGLYVNTGGVISGLANGALTATVVGGGANPSAAGVVYSNNKSNITFENLTVQESAAYSSGYGISVFGGSNVQVLNSTVLGAGKHAVGAIDTTGFVAKNISASNLMPDQGNGGATAFVAYSDYNSSNDTSQWINDSATNLNGPYLAFYTHSVPNANDPTPIASVLVKDLQASSGGIGGVMSGSGSFTIQGGTVTNAQISVYGNTVVDGVTLSGTTAYIELNGSNDVAQNNLITGAIPNWEGGKNGAIVDNGTGNIIRFNTIVVDPSAGPLAAAIGLGSISTGTQIYGNIFSTPGTLFFVEGNGSATPNIQALENLFSSSGGTGTLQITYWQLGDSTSVTTSLPNSISLGNLMGNPDFVNAASGDYALQPGSVAAYVFDPTTQQYVMTDIYGNTRPLTGDSLGAIQTVHEPAPIALFEAGIAVLALIGLRRIARRH